MESKKWFKEKEKEMGARLDQCKREQAVSEMLWDLSEVERVSLEAIEEIVEIAVEKGYRKERYGSWMLDDSFQSDTKARYKCTACGYWKIVKKQNAQSMLHSMRYCSGCGAMMTSTVAE